MPCRGAPPTITTAWGDLIFRVPARMLWGGSSGGVGRPPFWGRSVGAPFLWGVWVLQGRRAGSERGQSLPLVMVFLVSLIGMCAFAIDAGTWYQAKRAVQANADASALAGASQLPSGWSFGQAAAQTEFGTNRKPGDTATYANVTVNSSNDSVKVTVSRTSPSFFSNL